MRVARLGFMGGLAALAGCAGSLDHRDPASMPGPTIVATALELVGVRYRYGGDAPAEGFDCSGFVRYVYARHGIVLPRDAESMAAALPRVPVAARRSGDLLFFRTAARTDSHVGIAVDRDRFVHAPSVRSGAVRVSDLRSSYWRRRFTGVRRPAVASRSIAARARGSTIAGPREIKRDALSGRYRR